MLDALRKGAGTWVAKIFIGILVLSFAVWGIADIFGGFGRQTLAKIGDTEITSSQFQSELRRQLYNMSNRIGRQITMGEARRFGLPQQVLGQLVTDAALDDQARKLGLGLSDKTVAESIINDPSFKDDQGNFSRLRFDQILANNGMSEAMYSYRSKKVLVRQQIVQSIMTNMTPPKTMLRALDLYANEKREADYLLLPPAKAGEIAAPSEADIKAYYDEHPKTFTAPEYRKLSLLLLKPEDLLETVEVKDEDIKADYEAHLALYAVPETRTIEQLLFKTGQEAQQAYKKLQDGEDFYAVAKAFKIPEASIKIGSFTQEKMIDTAIASAAFALEKGAYSKPVKGTFGTAIVRVTQILPGTTRKLDEVKDEIRKKLALEKAADEVLNMHDSIEDLRAGGATLKEIAGQLNLKYRVIEAVNRTGDDPAGKLIADIPAGSDLLKLAFDSDVGVENDPLPTTDNGYVWVDVLAVTPSRLKPLDKVKDQVISLWTAKKRDEKLTAMAENFVKEVNNGKPLEEIAAGLGLKVEKSGTFTRLSKHKVFTAKLVQALFATARGKAVQGLAASNGAAKPGGRIVAVVTNIIIPDPDKPAANMASLKARAAQGLRGDLVSEYVDALRNRYGVKINNAVLQAAIGSEEAG
ncbi:MAG TPA: peptidylprolyl isomerase [Rhizobiales bacterium]|nr:peptidylprolyl isomerase [Hyphomicrobiales bacterium]